MVLQRRPLVIAIYDSKWFMRVLDIVKRRGIIFHHYYTPTDVPYGSVVYTDLEVVSRDLSHRGDVLVVYDPEKSCRSLEKALLATMYITGFRSILVGVDPGESISYVFLGDEILLLYGIGGVGDLIRDVEYVLSCMSFRELRVKIGSGSNSSDVIHAIKAKYRDLHIEVVDEYSTTPSKNRLEEATYLYKKLRGLKPFRYRDIYAAYRIALSKGVEVL